MTIRISRCGAHADGVPTPEYATSGAAGMDIHAAVGDDMRIEPGCFALVPSGFCIEVPRGYEAQIRPRSGLALKFGVTVLNAPGTIDADYRGEVGVILVNHGAQPFVVRRGDRIAQMVVAACDRVSWEEVPALDSTVRGVGGFGHSGVAKKS